MSSSKTYRDRAWQALKPVLPIMLLIFLVANLPDLLWTFLQNALNLNPPMDAALYSDPERFMQAYSAFASEHGVLYSLLSLLFSILPIPLTLGAVGASQRILRGEDVLVRHVLAYIPYTFRAIWLQICIVFYACGPMLLTLAVLLLAMLFLPASALNVLTVIFSIALIATGVLAIMRSYSMAAAEFLLAKQPETRVSALMECSRTLMQGQRMNCFLLELSFIGWGMLLTLVSLLVASLAGYLAYSICSMLLSLLLSAYLTTAKAAFMDDLDGSASSADESGKMTE